MDLPKEIILENKKEKDLGNIPKTPNRKFGLATRLRLRRD